MDGGDHHPLPDSDHHRGNRRSGPDLFTITCWCFSIVTSVAAILCIAVNVISAIISFKHGRDIFDGIFRCYAVLIALFVIVAETEWEFIFKFSRVFEFWVGRGMLQIFVAVMTRAFPEYKRNHSELFLLQSIGSYLLLACGVIYIISGLLCVGKLKRSRKKKALSRDQARKDLEDLDKRRAELEALLVDQA